MEDEWRRRLGGGGKTGKPYTKTLISDAGWKGEGYGLRGSGKGISGQRRLLDKKIIENILQWISKFERIYFIIFSCFFTFKDNNDF